ncbi:MAG: hypothetical protein KDD65_18715 [Bacteroidetes bacterium]|nr:hypothetical protein [Bacteroidota bacterium]
MKYLVPRILLLLSVVATGLYAAPAFAQDEYKEAYNAALESQKAKDYVQAYKDYEKAATLADKAGDKDIAEKARVMCAKLAKVNGTAQFKAEQYEAALATFEAGIKHEPKYDANVYMKGLTLSKLGRDDEALAAYLEASKSNDTKTARTAAKALRSYFTAAASEIVAKENISASDADRAIAYLDRMENEFEQEPDANSLFYRGLALKAKGQYADCVTTMDSAVDVHRGGATDKAKLFFTKGECLMLAGDNDAAKIAFGKAKFGSYAKPAQHFIDTL